MVTETKQYQTATYSDSQAKPFTRVPGCHTRKDRDFMYEEACDAATAVYVGYEWSVEFVFLAIVT